MKIDIFTGCTSVRSKQIFTAILRYPTGKHEIIIKALKKNGVAFVKGAIERNEFLDKCHKKWFLTAAGSVRSEGGVVSEQWSAWIA